MTTRKVSEDIVMKILKDYRDTDKTGGEIAREYGVSEGTVRKFVSKAGIYRERFTEYHDWDKIKGALNEK